MTVYIAVCDDNIADRKQTERLLEREKDARLKKDGDVLYIESFGSKDALMATPVKYDMFLIDIVDPKSNGMEIAKELRSYGIIAPIVLMSSSIDYTSYSNIPEDIIHIRKSITQGQISHLYDVARDWASKKPHLLEIRGKKDTCFLPHRELVRAVEKQDHVEVLIQDGTYIEVTGTIKDFLSVVDSYKCFISCKKSILNIHHIVKCEGNTMILDNGEVYDFSPLKLHELLVSLVEFTHAHEEGSEKC